jgi:hypothetical protein
VDKRSASSSQRGLHPITSLDDAALSVASQSRAWSRRNRPVLNPPPLSAAADLARRGSWTNGAVSLGDILTPTDDIAVDA